MAIVGTGPLGFSPNPRHRLEAYASSLCRGSRRAIPWVESPENRTYLRFGNPSGANRGKNIGRSNIAP